MQKKKHYGLKLLLILAALFCVWVYFWDKPAPEVSNVVDLSNDILQN